MEGGFPDPEDPCVFSIWRAGEVEEVGDTTSKCGTSSAAEFTRPMRLKNSLA
jgi:hypothetical protein